MEQKGHPSLPQPRSQAQSTINKNTIYSKVEQNEPNPSSQNAARTTDNLPRRKPIRSLFSLQTFVQFLTDIVLVVPPLLFIVYGFLVLHFEGRRSDTKVVRQLLSVAQYGPTIFPIIFAAIAGSFLKTAASWKLERGISVLSLEYLLSSRTVFSAITTPISLRAINFLTPIILALWSLSPLGGQAAIRIIAVVPNEVSLPWDFSYLDYNSAMRYHTPTSSSGETIMSTVVGTFTSALVAAKETKLGAVDTFGNLKIPMLEACRTGGALPDSDGWYDSLPGAGCNYSSLIGLPAVPQKATGSANMSFTFETMYMFTDCKLGHQPAQGQYERLGHLNGSIFHGLGPFTNAIHSFGIWFLKDHTKMREGPQELLFTSFSYDEITNATCTLTTTYVEAHTFCYRNECKVDRVRESTNPRNRTTLTVLDLLTPYNNMGHPAIGFFQAFAPGVNTHWDTMSPKLYSTPIEYYFTHPESPYSPEYNSSSGYRGVDIYPIGDMVFSQRFSQLLNTFWISSIAFNDVTGNFNGSADGRTDYAALSVTGKVTPDHLVLHCRRGWLAILIIASMTMLFAASATAILRLLRRGPDILDRASLILRDNPYVNVPAASSMEDGYQQARRLKDVQLFLGNARSGVEGGHIAIGTADAVTPLSAIKANSQLY